MGLGLAQLLHTQLDPSIDGLILLPVVQGRHQAKPWVLGACCVTRLPDAAAKAPTMMDLGSLSSQQRCCPIWGDDEEDIVIGLTQTKNVARTCKNKNGQRKRRESPLQASAEGTLG